MGNTITVQAPYDRRTISELPLHAAADLETMLSAAHTAFRERRWLQPHERIDVLSAIAALMQKHQDELVHIAAQEGGKPHADTLVEVKRAIQGVHVAIHAMHEQSGTEVPMGLTPSSTNRMAFTRREPIGVIASISAFNHPVNLTVHQTIPAIAVGCPVIIKPAMTTPLSCLRMMELYREAGLDEVWCRALIAETDVAERLVTDRRIGYLSFIGSPGVGWSLRSKLAPGARAALEHGGVAPVIVEADADVDAMIPALAKGGFYHAGQVCVSVQRVFAHKSVARKVANALTAAAEKLRVGDPLDPKTEVGPLITPANVDRVETWVREAVQQGAKALCGGERLSDTCYKPTVLWDPPADATVSQQEIFGPVVCVYPVKDRDEAIRRANDSPFAFQASVFTRDLDAAVDCVHRLNATAVMVNDHTAFRVDWMPFGGRDQSGLGMGGIPFTMEEMTRIKMMVIKSSVL
jgi:acyl-CoA reductase-like NAD-dependent aldehyde dehydrogenase